MSAVVLLCSALQSPYDLTRAYMLEAALRQRDAEEYRQLADTYEPFANDIAVLEEFAARQGGIEAYGVSASLDERAAWLRDESERLDVEADYLLHRADGVRAHYRGFAKLRVRAMRRECLSVLTSP